jgi:hypothetical protein
MLARRLVGSWVFPGFPGCAAGTRASGPICATGAIELRQRLVTPRVLRIGDQKLRPHIQQRSHARYGDRLRVANQDCRVR